jgi:hypothetical protein
MFGNEGHTWLDLEMQRDEGEDQALHRERVSHEGR